MHKRSLDLLVVALWVVCLCSTLPVENAVPVFVRSLSGALMLGSLFYATYSLLSALYREQFDAGMLAALTIGVFVGITLVIGLVLNVTPGGITRPMWMLGYGLFTMPILVATFAARPRSSAVVQWQLRPSRLMRTLTIVGLIAASYLVARVGLAQQPREGFTGFWLLQDDTSPGITLDLGVTSGENLPEQYRVELTSGDTVIRTWDAIDLDPQGTWQTSLELPSEGIIYPVIGRLYLAGDDKAYRRVEFWLHSE